MAKTENYFGKVLMPERAIKRKSRENNKEVIYKPLIKGVALCAEGFLLGRINLFNALNPVGIAFLSACMDKGSVFYAVCLSVFMGYATGSDFFGKYGYWISIACCAAISFWYDGKDKPVNERKKIFCGGISLLSGGVMVAFLNGMSAFLMVRSVAESIAVMMLTVLFSRSMGRVQRDVKRKIFTSDDALCIAAPLVFSLASLCGVSVFGEPMRNMLCTLFVLMASYVCGNSAGCALAVVLSFVLIVCGQADTTFLTVLSFGALMSGILGRKSKFIASVLFLSAFFVPSFYMGAELNKETVALTLLGTVMFMMVPQKIYSLLSTYSSDKKEFDENKYYIKVREYVEEKIRKLSMSFCALADVFASSQEMSDNITPESSMKIINMVTDRVCSECGLGVYCWKGRMLESYGAVYAMINDFEKTGDVDVKCVPEGFGKSCVKINRLAEVVNSCCREFKTGEIWKRRLDDSRFIIKQQLEELKKLTEEMKENVDFRPFFDESIEKEIKERLIKKGFAVNSVVAVTEENGRIKVSLEGDVCGGKERCSHVFAGEISSVCGKNMVLADKNCNGPRCVSVFEEENDFGCSYVYCSRAMDGNEVSGDGFEVKKYRSDVFTALISDGMGTGEMAAKQSRDVLEKMSKLMNNGFDEETALKAVNCSMLGYKGESFATLDALSIDLRNGKSRLIKNGGSTAFVIRNGEATAIKSTSLPLGILAAAESEITKFELQDKDVVLMITDGISDALEDEEREVGKIAKQTGNTKLLCSEIIKLAVEKNNGCAKDDMLALAIKIYEN